MFSSKVGILKIKKEMFERFAIYVAILADSIVLSQIFSVFKFLEQPSFRKNATILGIFSITTFKVIKLRMV